MRLLACPTCHAQYDVTTLAAERFPCRCGEELENRRLEAVDATIRRCGSCGASIGAADLRCGYCGSEVERDPGKLSLICPECYARCAESSRFCNACGVGFAPEAAPAPGVERICPVCDRLMPARVIAGVGINECPGCNGLWVPGEALDQLVERALAARRDSPEPAAPRLADANPAQQAVAYRKCPDCMAYMQRRNFRRRSGVILDVCHEHGTWLDADELERIAGFVLAGGGRHAPGEPGFQERRALARAAAIQQRHAPHRGPAGAAQSLLETLHRLLS